MSLQVKGLTKRFGSRLAVDHISFSMEQPGVFGLIGTNGAGKTTTIRMILGILAEDSGSSDWNGTRITRESLAFGYLPEERGLYMKHKVTDQLVYFAMLRGMNRTDAQTAAKRWLERLEISEYAQTPAEKLSKGNQQKVQLAAALIHDPILLFLDEPFSGLDPVNTELLREIIGELVDSGKYIVMSSPQMATVEEYCRDLLLLHQGQSVLQGNLQEIKASYGHTNLVVSCPQDPTADAEACGLTLLDRRADLLEFHIDGDKAAAAFLKRLVDTGNYPLHYEVKEPSLQEIFLQRVEAKQEESAK